MKELKEFFIGDCYNTITKRKVAFAVLVCIMIMVLMAVDSLPMGVTMAGLFGPIALIWKFDLTKDFKDTDFLSEE